MRPTMPSPQQVNQLPPLITTRVPPEWEDINGHVNVQHYLELYDLAGDTMLAQLGIDEDHFRLGRQGFFDLEHHVWYLAEIHVGDEVSVHLRYLARSAKRMHGLVFVLNASRGQLSSVMEFVSTGADLDARRTAALPPDVAERLDGLVAAHAALDWAPPCCGVMSA